MKSDRYPNTPPLHRYRNRESEEPNRRFSKSEEFNHRVDRAVEKLLYHGRDQRAATQMRRARIRRERIRFGLYVTAMTVGATAIVLLATTWLAPTANAQTFWQGFNQGLHLYYGQPYQPPQRPQATPVPRPAPLQQPPFQSRTPAMLPTEPEHNAGRYIPRSDSINTFTGTIVMPGREN